MCNNSRLISLCCRDEKQWCTKEGATKATQMVNVYCQGLVEDQRWHLDGYIGGCRHEKPILVGSQLTAQEVGTWHHALQQTAEGVGGFGGTRASMFAWWR
jgi:hypothetical protein